MKTAFLKVALLLGLSTLLLTGLQGWALDRVEDGGSYATSHRQEAPLLPYTGNTMEKLDAPAVAVLHGRGNKNDCAVMIKGIFCTPLCLVVDVVCLPWELCKLLWTSEPRAFPDGND